MIKTRQQVITYLNTKFDNNYQLYTPDSNKTFTQEYWESCEWGQVGAPMNKISPPPITWQEIINNA